MDQASLTGHLRPSEAVSKKAAASWTPTLWRRGYREPLRDVRLRDSARGPQAELGTQKCDSALLQ